jgi:hypothetical protein
LPVASPGAGCSSVALGLYSYRGQPGSRSAFRFGGTCLRKVRAPWARRQVTPGHGVRVVTDSATENRPPQNIVVRVKRWGKSPPRFPATEAARQTPPEQGQIGGEENAHSDQDTAGRLHEDGGDSVPRGMTAAELRLRHRTRLTGCSQRRPGSRERSWALILSASKEQAATLRANSKLCYLLGVSPPIAAASRGKRICRLPPSSPAGPSPHAPRS